MDDTHGPYNLAPFLTRSSYVTFGLSRTREETVLGGGWGISWGLIKPLVELYSRSTAETAEWSVVGRYVWQESGWFAGGGVERGGTEESPSEQDVQSSAYRVVGGKYLGDTTALDVALGTSSDQRDPDEVVCKAFARRCVGLAGTDTDSDDTGGRVGKLSDVPARVSGQLRLTRLTAFGKTQGAIPRPCPSARSTGARPR